MRIGTEQLELDEVAHVLGMNRIEALRALRAAGVEGVISYFGPYCISHTYFTFSGIE